MWFSKWPFHQDTFTQKKPTVISGFSKKWPVAEMNGRTKLAVVFRQCNGNMSLLVQKDHFLFRQFVWAPCFSRWGKAKVEECQQTIMHHEFGECDEYLFLWNVEGVFVSHTHCMTSINSLFICWSSIATIAEDPSLARVRLRQWSLCYMMFGGWLMIESKLNVVSWTVGSEMSVPNESPTTTFWKETIREFYVCFETIFNSL